MRSVRTSGVNVVLYAEFEIDPHSFRERDLNRIGNDRYRYLTSGKGAVRSAAPFCDLRIYILLIYSFF